jgi:hypothetical protein
MTNPNPSPMEAHDAVRALEREVERHAAGRDDLAHFAAWVRTRLTMLAEELTPAHRSRPIVANVSRRPSSTLN